MRFESIASGSSGNCIYVGSDRTHLLMDVGISRKRTGQALHDIGLDFKDIDGIFLTHEHSDHIMGLPVIAKYSQMPIYATRGTIRALAGMPKYRDIDPDRFICIRADEPVSVGDLKIDPMAISHDAAEPVGYRVYEGSKKACICNMLQVGHYPYSLKQRILGNRGHLSNAASGQLLSRVLNSHLKGIFLGHLSKENNIPELAFETVRVELMFSEAGYRAEELPIRVADRDVPSGLVEV